MIMIDRKRLIFLTLSVLLSLLIFSFCSCVARIEGVMSDGGAASVTLVTSLEPRTLGLLSSIRNFMGESSGTQVLDANSISRSMAAAPGIQSVSLKNIGPEALEGTISISHVGDFLVSGSDRFIAYTQGRTPGTSSIIISLDLETSPVIISMLSPDVMEYLSALMAPAATGERLTKSEYLDLVSSIYGRPMSDEIAAARINAFIEFPRPPSKVTGGNARGRIAEFSVPLVDILVLDEPLRFEVGW